MLSNLFNEKCWMNIAAFLLATVGFCQASPNLPEPNSAALKQAEVRQNQAIELESTGKYEEACEIWNKIIESEPNSYEAYYERCSCLASWVERKKEFNLLAKARDDYEKLKTLSLVNNDNPNIREWQARAGLNLTVVYISAGKIDDIRSICDQLKLLANNHQDEPELRHIQAATNSNLVHAYSKANKPNDARIIYEEIKSLAEKYPGEAVLRENQAGAGEILVAMYGDGKKMDDANQMVEQMKELADLHKDESALRVQEIWAVYRLVDGYRKAGNIPKSKVLLNELEQRVKDLPKGMQQDMLLDNIKYEWQQPEMQGGKTEETNK